MKVNKLFLCTVASLLTVQTMSPDFIQSIHQSNGRKPATDVEADAPTINYYATVEAKSTRDSSPESEEEAQTEKSVLNKNNVAKLKLKNGKSPSIQGINVDNDDSGLSFRLQDKKQPTSNVGPCEAELVGQKLVDATAKSIQDNNQVVALELKADSKVEPKKVEEKKTEEKKVLTEVKEVKEVDEDKIITKKKKPKIKVTDASEDSNLISFMSGITSMFDKQMQSFISMMDKQMQAQMDLIKSLLPLTSMYSQAPRETAPQANPYSYGPAFHNPTLMERIGFLESRVGVAAPSYQNPYQIMPQPTLERQALPDYGGFRIPATMNPGFNFHQVSPEPTARINMPEPLVMEPPMSFIGK